jgi:hypothetical protein
VQSYLLRGDDMANGNFGDGSNFDKAIYYVEDAEDYMALASVENKGSSDVHGQIILKNDIDFHEVGDWTGWASEIWYYCDFDGCGYALKNLEIQLNPSTQSSLYFFPPLFDGFTIQNVTLKNIQITGKSTVHIITVRSNGLIDNVIIENSCLFDNLQNVYAIHSYYNAPTINRCAIGGVYNTYEAHLLYTNGGIIKNTYINATINATGGNIYASDSNATRINNFCRIILNGKISSNSRVYNRGTAAFCYCANINNTGTKWDCFNNVTVYKCLYDLTSDTASTLGIQATAEQLQDADWLRRQGWAI